MESLLDSLMRQKEALQNRKDLSEEDKDRLARTLRRQIRKARLTDGSPEPLTGQRQTESTPRVRRARGSAVVHRSVFNDPELFAEFKGEVQEWLQDTGLTYQDSHELVENKVYGYGLSFVFLFENDVTGDQIMEKFHNRWANKQPTWYAVRGEGTAEILLLGPLPLGMTQG